MSSFYDSVKMAAFNENLSDESKVDLIQKMVQSYHNAPEYPLNSYAVYPVLTEETDG